MAPVALALRVLGRIAVDLGGRRDQDARPGLARHLQQIERALHRGPDGTHGVALVVHRRCGAGQVEDLVDLHGQRVLHVMAVQLETRVGQQVRHIGACAGEEVVQAHDIVAFLDQAFAQVRAEKPSPSCDQYACVSLHWDFLPPGFTRVAIRA